MKFSVKKHHAWVVACLLSATISFAQNSAATSQADKKDHPHKKDDRGDREGIWMKQNLKLTDEQYAKVSALNKEYDAKMRPGDGKEMPPRTAENTGAKPMKKLTPEEQKQREKWQAEKETKLKTILTAQQWKDYEAKKKDMPKGHGGHDGKMKPEGKPKPTE